MAINTKAKRWSMLNAHLGAVRQPGAVATGSNAEATRVHRLIRYNGNGLGAPAAPGGPTASSLEYAVLKRLAHYAASSRKAHLEAIDQ